MDKEVNKKPVIQHIDFFAGCGGWSVGFSEAGIKTIIAIDIDKAAKINHDHNFPGCDFLLEDISQLTPQALHRRYPELKINDPYMIFTASPPCQFWSHAAGGTKRSNTAAQSKHLVDYFADFVAYFQPMAIALENVPNWRKQEKESHLLVLKEKLNIWGYHYDEGIINACDHGVPQNRVRYILMAEKHQQNQLLTGIQRGVELRAGEIPGTSMDGMRPATVVEQREAGAEDWIIEAAEAHASRCRQKDKTYKELCDQFGAFRYADRDRRQKGQASKEC